MEIKRIINLCKSSNGLILYENEGEQWISDGYALFPLTEMPLFDEETICRTYDISEKKAAKMSIRHEMKLPPRISIAGDVEGEMPCEFDDELFARIVPVWTSRGADVYPKALSDALCRHPCGYAVSVREAHTRRRRVFCREGGLSAYGPDRAL